MSVKVISSNTRQIFVVDLDKRYSTCPECSHTRRKSKDKCVSWRVEENRGHCWHCDTTFFEHNPKEVIEYIVPEWKNITKLSDKAVRWFNGRMIRQETLNKMRVYSDQEWMPQFRDKGKVEVICFPYFFKGNLVNIKYRAEGKAFRLHTGSELILWNLDKIGKKVIIVEGEIDLLSFVEIGIDWVVSVPNGANKTLDYLDDYIEDFKDCEVIYLATDNDEKGIILRDELARRLGVERCWLVNFRDKKDANAYHVEYGGVDLRKALDEAKRYPVKGIVQIDQIYHEILALWDDGVQPGVMLGMEEIDQFISWELGRLAIVTGIPSHGKALGVKELIPTPDGFVKMGDLKVGDVVFDENGEECKIINATEIMHGRDCYEVVFSDRSRVVCDGEHKWMTDCDKARRSMRLAKRRGREDGGKVKPKGKDQTHLRTWPSAKTTCEIKDTLRARDRNNHLVRFSESVKYTEKDLLIDPYVLGCWLGDGDTGNGGITSADQEIIDIISKSYCVTKRKAKYRYGILGLLSDLRKIGVLGDKHIPQEYLLSSEEQRMELLRGLMDTDGTVSKIHGRCEFSQSDERLARQVYTLVCSLGIKCTIVKRPIKLNGRSMKDSFRVTFQTNKKVFNLERKQRFVRGDDAKRHRTIVAVNPVKSVPVRCIEVDSPSHLFLCTEAYIPTHNSTFIDFLVALLNILHGWKVAHFTPENYPLKFHYAKAYAQMIGTKFGKDHDKSEGVNFDLAYDYMRENYFYIMDEEDHSIDMILEAAKSLVRGKGVKVLVIDPYNKIDHKRERGVSETDYISTFLDRLLRFAQMNGVLVILVAHPRKMSKKKGELKFDVPTLYDISGSANFYNKADYGFTIYRDLQDETDGTVLKNEIEVHWQKIKFRHLGVQGVSNLRYNINSGRFMGGLVDEIGWDNRNWLVEMAEGVESLDPLDGTSDNKRFVASFNDPEDEGYTVKYDDNGVPDF